MKTPRVPRWMRNLMMGIIALILINPNEAEAKNPAGVSFQVFYDELMPYGDWVKDGRYGYVWLPAVYEDFHPYGTNGHWVMTRYGNTWVSDYDWGWATFHYGRWYFDDNYRSWAWIPDYNWGPAWVDWRTGGGYYGWAPMGPGFTLNVRMTIPTSYWVFVPQNRFIHHNVYSYSVPRANRVKIYNRTTIINNTVVYNNNHYYAGPARRDIERVTKRSYPERRIENSKAPGRTVASRNSVSAYRPDLQSARGTSTDARPSRVLTSGQARTQPAAAPSRTNGRTEAASGRTVTTPARTSGSTERATAPSSRSENPGVKSTAPSSNRGSVETRPSSGTQTRTASPTRQSQASPTNSRSNEVKSSSPAVRPQSTAQPQQRSTPARTQTAPAQRSTPARTQASSPATRSTPAKTTQTREATPAPSRSTQEVKSAPTRSSTPAPASRSSSGSSSSRGTSSTRGNN
ncbi:hypothetical protein J2X69_002353 [Algoriphagus sp. 4150]|uniref:DUF6600 domain-containing protein n=1 Tax=Algoriphagus sp. 4150 TaxID=2817756 RepID=UPI00285EA45F|nr:DUF6600 domain-containing protein [Algoriphagus sp. 4150]MDR7130006.1 hypothetical protein [Algoriphagus sp. 4150]